MDSDQEVVNEADLALVAATQKYIDAPPWEKAQLAPGLDQARGKWAAARYRLLFPDLVTTHADVEEARRLRQRVEQAADTQQTIQAVFDLAGLLVKFAH